MPWRSKYIRIVSYIYGSRGEPSWNGNIISFGWHFMSSDKILSHHSDILSPLRNIISSRRDDHVSRQDDILSPHADKKSPWWLKMPSWRNKKSSGRNKYRPDETFFVSTWHFSASVLTDFQVWFFGNLSAEFYVASYWIYSNRVKVNGRRTVFL